MDYKDIKLDIEELLSFKILLTKIFYTDSWRQKRSSMVLLIHLINAHSFFLEEVQPRLLGKTAIACSNKDDYKQLMDKIVDLTDKTILFVDGAVEFIENIQYDLIKAIKDIYPEANPIFSEQIE